jgi:Spy/CpxP family protein refolding chaperone
MKNVILAAAAGLAIVAGAVVVDAHRPSTCSGRPECVEGRARADRGAFVADHARGDQGISAQGGRGPGGRGPGRGGRGGPGRLGGPMLEALDLTDDQRTKIQELHRSSREAGRTIAEELAQAQRSLHLATFAASRDDGEIAKLTSTIGNLEKQMLDLRVKTDLEIAAVLTAEQREKVRTAEGRGRGRGR